MPRFVLLLLLLPVLVLGCEEDEELVLRSTCEVTLDAVEPDRGPVSGGTETALTGLWLVSDLGERDTAVHIGGTSARVLEVEHGAGCGPCDACLATAQLRCGECTRICRGLAPYVEADGTERELEVCEDRVLVVTPAVEQPGEAGVSLTTSRGAASGPVFTYEAR